MNEQGPPFNLMFPLNYLPKSLHRRKNVRGDVLIGSSRSLKTSILFQAAVTLCKNDSPTLFVRPKPLNFLPASVNGMSQPNQILPQMDNLNFIYVDHFQQLIAYLANFPFNSICNSHPIDVSAMLIVDDFDHYLAHLQIDKSSYDHRLAKLCCLLLEVAEFCARKRSGLVHVVISCNGVENGADLRFMKCFKRYFDGLWRITPSHSSNLLVIESQGGDDDLKYILIENKKDEILLKRIGTNQDKPFTDFN